MKTHFLRRLLIEQSAQGRPFNVVEMGCGIPLYIEPLLEEFPQLSYVGIEPFPPSFKAAQKALANFPPERVQLYHQLGYELPREVTGADLVFSLSVLEHVKNLPAFIEASTKAAKSGAPVVHLYDLGHSLRPSSLKERFQVFLGNTFPWILPEDKFVRYVPQTEVEMLVHRSGCEITHTTYHQMPNHKALLKTLPQSVEADLLKNQIYDWEFDVSPYASQLPAGKREQLFLSVCVHATRV